MRVRSPFPLLVLVVSACTSDSDAPLLTAPVSQSRHESPDLHRILDALGGRASMVGNVGALHGSPEDQVIHSLDPHRSFRVTQSASGPRLEVGGALSADLFTEPWQFVYMPIADVGNVSLPHGGPIIKGTYLKALQGVFYSGIFHAVSGWRNDSLFYSVFTKWVYQRFVSDTGSSYGWRTKTVPGTQLTDTVPGGGGVPLPATNVLLYYKLDVRSGAGFLNGGDN